MARLQGNAHTEGPDPQGREGEGRAGGDTLTRLASLATLSRGAGEGQKR